jgi:hypothetical protein
MKISGDILLILIILLLSGCDQKAKYIDEVGKTDSLITLLQGSFDQYQHIDTTALAADFKALVKTEKYAGLAFDYPKIDSLKLQLKQLMREDRLIRSTGKKLLARTKLLKQSLLHNEYDSLTFSIYMANIEKEVNALTIRMESTFRQIKNWNTQSDSVLNTLRLTNPQPAE